MSQDRWEEALEDALNEATPEQVLVIIRKIKGWLVGYCIICGKYTDTCGGRKGCDCPNNGMYDL